MRPVARLAPNFLDGPEQQTKRIMAQKKKFVYFLGAGASFGAGAAATVQAGGKVPIPTQTNFWSTFLRFCKSSQRRKSIESFLFRYFLGYGRTPTRLNSPARRQLLASVDVEEVSPFLASAQAHRRPRLNCAPTRPVFGLP